MFKILICHCSKLLLKEKNVDYQYFKHFDAGLCQEDHEIFVVECKNCRYKVYLAFLEIIFTASTALAGVLTNMLPVLTVNSLSMH